jgi:hypothetical protein
MSKSKDGVNPNLLIVLASLDNGQLCYEFVKVWCNRIN